MTSNAMQIGDLAKHCGVTIDTVRYYEKQKLLIPDGRTAAGYRRYSEDSIRRLSFILKSKSLGFTLKEIRELLEIKVSPEQFECSEVKNMAEAKLSDIEHKISELKQIQAALGSIAEQCCGGQEPATACSILDALSNEMNNDREE